MAVVSGDTPATYGSCDACSNDKYDCLNGACIDKDIYKTPGIYQSIEECQVACGTGCSGVCLTASEWSTIQGLASQNKSRHCS
ncbi:hypothetical protein [Sphaerospermopsis aphanizomenoides]|uniref:hypothetical protein n=1 Tax=Sphaerospermopsis aphanizomenoides TaxID=459663 RepID=UPI001907FBA8|nr:hypothetical protein [Sphaerospermopsis aphanizomenoides]